MYACCAFTLQRETGFRSYSLLSYILRAEQEGENVRRLLWLLQNEEGSMVIRSTLEKGHNESNTKMTWDSVYLDKLPPFK
jgi:hypothetical protein